MDAGIWQELIESAFANPAGESFVQTLALHIDPGFLLIDTRGFCLYANRAMQVMTGFSADDFSSQPIHDLIHHHHLDGSPFPKEECSLHKAMVTGSRFDRDEESLFYRKDGSTFHAFCRIEPVRYQENMLCMVMELRDIVYIRQAAIRKFGTELTYRLAVDLANIGTWERDLKTDLVKQSPKTSEILGLGSGHTELLGSELLQCIVREDREPFGQALQAALVRQEAFDLVFRIRRPDGAICWVATRGTSVKDAHGMPARVAGVMFDVTSRKEEEEDRHAAMISHQLAIEAANIGTWELEFSDGSSTVSPISRKILGLPADRASLSLSEWQSTIFPDDRELVAQAQQAAVHSGEAFQLEFRLIRPEGKIVWVASRGIVKNDEQGRPYKAIGVMIDITEKKEAEESLRQSMRRLSLILESSSEGIYGIKADHHCTFINRAGAAMLGYEPDELIGQPVHRLLHGRADDENEALTKEHRLLQAVGRGATMRIEDDVFWRKDGSSCPVAYSVSPIFAEGKTRGAVIVFTDITQRKQMQEQERRLAAEARTAAAMNAKFRTFFERGANFSGLLTVDGTLIEVNRLALDACGYAREEVIGKKFWECGWWNRSLAVMDAIRQGCREARGGKTFRREMPYFLVSGEERIVDLVLAPVVGDMGDVLYIAPTGTDITERKRADEALKASETRFRIMAEFSPDAILVQVGERFVYANPSAARLFGVPDICRILGYKAYDFIDPACHERVKNHLERVVRLNQHMAFIELELKRPDGSVAYVQVSSGKAFWEGQPAVQCMLRDMTEFRQMQDRLRQTSERLKLAIEGSGEGIWDWDIVRNRYTFSGGLSRILGRTDPGAYSDAIEWRKAIHPDDYERVMATFQDALEEKTPLYECEYRLRTRDGDSKWIWARGVIVERDEQGRPLTMTGTLSDITARKESDELAWRHANLDALTGLPNRRLFRERLEREVLKVKRSDHQLAVLFIDLDGFKQVNDSYGHDAGDLLLKEAARRLKSCVRETDTVARLGGDEFTVVLTELNGLDHVEFVCQKILASLAESFQLGKDIGYISGSIGVSVYPLDAMAPDDLIRKADQAMYAAKHTGKNQFSYFTREMDDRAHTRLHITNELRRALRQEQLEVHYQPVIDLKSGKIVKAEALLRWHHPVLGHIGPADFIPMAEEAGLIAQIGNWVFKEAALCCKDCMASTGIPFQIGVNKSPIQFIARETDTNWLHFLSEQGLPPHSISVEITESVLLQSSVRVEDRLTQFREAGVEIALDDFGTGYSSLSYLQKFKIDYVKIDQSFVQNMCSDPNSLTIAETIIVMAHKLGQKVIAEGIETQEQLDYLTRAGCDYGQGFWFSYPVPSESLIELLSSQSRSGYN